MKTKAKTFVNGHRFHGNRSIKLTKKSLKASFLEGLMKESLEKSEKLHHM